MKGWQGGCEIGGDMVENYGVKRMVWTEDDWGRWGRRWNEMKNLAQTEPFPGL